MRRWVLSAIAALVPGRALAQWPPPAPDLPAEFYRNPDNQPNDPGFGPGADCAGEWHLYGFAPDCAVELREAEQQAGIGVGVDRAWALTRGSPEAVILMMSDGLDAADAGAAVWLNPGELPPPQFTGAPGHHDANGDGRFDVFDYTDPSLRARDERLVARADGGDTNGNGVIDPADLLRVLGMNGIDDDANGFVDDAIGWDFIDEDPDPSAPGEGPGAALTRRLAAAVNDGAAGAGVCPACPVVLARVPRDRASWAQIARALDYAARSARARVAVLDAQVGPRQRGRPLPDDVLVVRATGPSGAVGPLGLGAGELVVASFAPDGPLSDATTTLAPAPERRVDRGVLVGAPREAAVIAAGVAGLCIAAAPEPPSARALAANLVQTARSLGRRSPPRIDAAAAVAAAAAGRQFSSARVLPRGRVLNPDAAHPLSVDLALEAPVRVQVVARLAPGARQRDLTLLDFDARAGRMSVSAELDVSGLLVDPVRPPDALEDAQALIEVSLDGRVVDRSVVVLHRDLELFPGFPVDIDDGVEASPLTYDGRVWIATASGRLLTVDPRTAQIALEADGLAPIRFSPTVSSEGHVGVIDEEGQVLELRTEGPRTRETGLRPSQPLVRGAEGSFVVGFGGIDVEGVTFERQGAAPAATFEGSTWTGDGLALVRLEAGEVVQRAGLEAPVTWLVTGVEDERGVMALADGRLFAFDLKTLQTQRLPGAPLTRRFAVSSLDRRGLDLVGTEGAELFAYDLRSEEHVPGFPVSLPGLPSAPVFPVDVDGDARAEVVHQSRDGLLDATGREGTPAPGFPKPVGGTLLGSPVAADLDGDGANEVVAVTREGLVWIWRTAGRPPELWATGYRDRGASLDIRNPIAPDRAPSSGCRTTHSGLWLSLLALVRMKKPRSSRTP